MYAVSLGSHCTYRLLKGIQPREVLEELQRKGDDEPARPRCRIEEWYRPNLGTFLSIDKDGVLCNPEYSGSPPTRLNNARQGILSSSILGQPLSDETEFDMARSPIAPEYGYLINGTFWPNLENGTDFGHHTSELQQSTEGLVSPCSHAG